MLIVEVKRGDIEGALKKLKGKFIDTKVNVTYTDINLC